MTAQVFSAADHEFMARALRLAERGLFSTTPNPRVGCVIVRGNRIVGEGWHRQAGEPHAEVLALAAAGEQARAATVYVTLEPCTHQGRTPPCLPALLSSGVKRVVAAMLDPNPLVSGQGIAGLRAAGVSAEFGLLADQAAELNVGFVARMTRSRPWLRLKVAASLDGKTALRNGASQWLTGPAARLDGHRWRARSCAILTGIGTVCGDDPQLNVRGIDETSRGIRQPLKVVVDSHLRLPLKAKVLRDANILVAAADVEPRRLAALENAGAEVVVFPGEDGQIDVRALLEALAQRGVNEVHAEAGSRLNGSLLAAGCVDELLLYLAPCLIGDAAHGMFELPMLTSLADKRRLKIHDLRLLGPDVRVLARFT